jgi:hypothetical protein
MLRRAPAAGDTLRAFNCTRETVFITVFEEADPVYYIRRSELLPNCDTVPVECSGKCQGEPAEQPPGGGCVNVQIVSGAHTYGANGSPVDTPGMRDHSDDAAWDWFCSCSRDEMQW